MSDYAELRERMVDRQIAARGLHDPKLLAAFRAVPREEFINPSYAGYAYQDSPLPIEAGQTICQPYIVALTIDAAGIAPGDKVLEVGAGSGYAAAVIGQVAARGDRRRAPSASWPSWRGSGWSGSATTMSASSRATAPLGLARGSAVRRDLSPRRAAAMCPKRCIDQLTPGGRSSCRSANPTAVQIAGQGHQARGWHDLTRRILAAVRFVPLIGAHGFPDSGSEALIATSAADDRRGRRAAARARRSRLRRVVRPLADARVVLLGEASHGTSRILPRPRGDHPAAGRAARLHHRRGGGRLARRGDASTATSATGPSGKGRRQAFRASRPGCGATASSRRSCAG